MLSFREEGTMGTQGRGRVWWLTGASWASFAMYAVTLSVLSVSLETIGNELGLGFEARGLLAPTRSFMIATSTLLCGYWADRSGKRWLIAGGMGLVAVGLLCAGLGRTYASLMGATIVIGAGLGAAEALVSPLIAELHPGAVALQMNVLHGFFPVGLGASAVLVGAVLDRGVPWGVPFSVAAAPAVLLAIAFAAGTYPDAAPGLRRAPVRVGAILRSRVFWELAVAMALTAGSEGSLIYWVPSFIGTEYGASAQVAAYGLLAFGMAMALGRFGTSVALRRVSLERLMMGVALVGAAAGACLALVPHLWASLAALLVAGLCLACFWPGVLSFAVMHIEAGSATLLAMLAVAGIAGFGVMPWTVGLVAGQAGLRAGFLIVPVALVATAAVVRAAARRR